MKISSEFVDWLTQRGEAYEHNMNAVDDLKQLADPLIQENRLVLTNMEFQTVVLKHSKTFTYSNYRIMHFLKLVTSLHYY